MDIESLASRVQSLPQELYNIILLDVFTHDASTHEIKPDHKPLKLLSFNRLTRDIYAKAYYGGHDSGFIIHVPPDRNLSLAMQWLKSLTPEHLGMVKRFTFIHHGPIDHDLFILGRRANKDLGCNLKRRVKMCLSDNGIR